MAGHITISCHAVGRLCDDHAVLTNQGREGQLALMG
jgi:hypothetical protein